MFINTVLKFSEYTQINYLYHEEKVPFMNVGTIGKPVGSLDILVHLLRNEKATVTNLITDAGLNQRTTYSAISSLLEQNLICQEVDNGFPVCKYYKLTNRGKAIAVHLDTIDGLLLKG